VRAKRKPTRKAKPLRIPAPEPERAAMILALARQAEEALIRDELKALVRLLRAAIAKKPKLKGSTVGRWRRRMREFEVLNAYGDRYLLNREDRERRAKALGFTSDPSEALDAWETLERVALRYFARARARGVPF
jgi:hypothetical protein